MSDLAEKPIFVADEEIVAENVSAEDYLILYADSHHEWVQGTVIKKSPASQDHNHLTVYLTYLFGSYFDQNPIGQFFVADFTMRLENSMRDPDILIILNDNPHELTKTFIRGAGDLCVEIVSPDSVGRDYQTKLKEYEAAGVREYLVIDPLRQHAVFYQLQSEGHYLAGSLTAEKYYESAVLPNLKFHIPILWQPQLPDIEEVIAMVNAMFEDTGK
jgi:Uma2 family endonuclease